MTPVNLTFVATGWISACYRLTCDDGTDWFLKLQPLSGPQATAASFPAFYLPLSRELHMSGWLPDIAYPISTNSGYLCACWEGWRVILHSYIKGQVVGHDGMTDSIVDRLAGLVGRLHRSLSSLNLQVHFYDAYEISFAGQIVDVLTSLETTDRTDTVGQQGLRDLLLPRRHDVLSALHRVQTLGHRAKAAEPAVVVCHADLHGENLMLDDADRLHIVDWEGAILAPPEQDLFMFADEPRFQDLFLPAYEAEAGTVVLDPDLLEFYSLRRLLEDLADWILRLATGEQGDVQDAADLLELKNTLASLPS